MENYKVNPKVKTSAYALYELMIKYGPKILSTDEARNINRSICEIYLTLSMEEIDKFISSLKKLNFYTESESKVLNENITFFTDYTNDSPLKTLNNLVLESLNGLRINQDSIDFVLDKMKDKSKITKRKSKTFISIAEGVIDQLKRESRGIEVKTAEYIKRKLNIWYNEVLERGIEEVSKDEVWADHKLTRDDGLKGKRSVRLSHAGRVIYKLDQEIVEDTIINKVTIVKITATHDYSD